MHLFVDVWIVFSFEISIPGLIIFTMLILGSSPKANPSLATGGEAWFLMIRTVPQSLHLPKIKD